MHRGCAAPSVVRSAVHRLGQLHSAHRRRPLRSWTALGPVQWNVQRQRMVRGVGDCRGQLPRLVRGGLRRNVHSGYSSFGPLRGPVHGKLHRDLHCNGGDGNGREQCAMHGHLQWSLRRGLRLRSRQAGALRRLVQRHLHRQLQARRERKCHVRRDGQLQGRVQRHVHGPQV